MPVSELISRICHTFSLLFFPENMWNFISKYNCPVKVIVNASDGFNSWNIRHFAQRGTDVTKRLLKFIELLICIIQQLSFQQPAHLAYRCIKSVTIINLHKLQLILYNWQMALDWKLVFNSSLMLWMNSFLRIITISDY